MIRIILAVLALVALASTAEARQRNKTYLADPACNGTGPNAMTCAGVAPSPRGERIARQVGFGAAQKVYSPRVTNVDWRAGTRQNKVRRGKVVRTETASYGVPQPSLGYTVRRAVSAVTQVVAHPTGCPGRAFCGCGAAVRLFGAPIRSLWLAANWFKFPRAAPAPGMAAVRRHHVFVLEADLGGGLWRVYDANSGGHATRIHARSIAGYVIVNPRGGAA